MLKYKFKIYLKNFISKSLLIAFDISLMVVLFFAAYKVRLVFFSYGHLEIPSPPADYFYSYWYLLIVYIIFFSIYNIYHLRLPFWLEVKEIVKAVAISTVSVFFILAVLKISQEVSRFIIIFMSICAIFIIPVFKIILKFVLYRLNIWQVNVLIIAKPDKEFDTYCRRIKGNWYVGYRPGFIIKVKLKDKALINDIFTSKRIEKIIKDNNIVVPVLYKLDKDEFYDIFIKLDIFFEKIKLIPDMHSLFINNLRIENDGYNLLINIENNLLKLNNRMLQYIFNRLASILIFIFSLPVSILLGLLIKFDSEGKVLYKSKRIGYGNREYYVYKFRTMYEDADNKLKELLKNDRNLKKEFKDNFKLKNDPRITKIGKFLRKTSLDELPQLINVLLGQMNLVGPRPIVKEEIEKYGDAIEELAKVKPGMTGLWQVSGRNDITYEKRVQLDLFYIKNWSLWMDIMILMKTFFVVIRGKGAY